MINNHIMIDNDKLHHSYVVTHVLDEKHNVVTDGVIGVCFSFGGITFQNIFIWYNPLKNIFENESEQPIIIVYEYISPDQVFLFKSNKKQRQVFIKRSNYTSITFVNIRKKDSDTKE